MREDLKKEIEIPEGLTVKTGPVIQISGPQGEVKKKLLHPKIKITSTPNKILLESPQSTKKEKKTLHTFHYHLKNMIAGVLEKHIYKLKICSGHFPMNVSVNNNQLLIKNFLGENTPRKLNIKPGVEVKVEGDEILVSSPDKESAGQVAADIEQLTKIKNWDIRLFQDGCHIIHKAGKNLN